VTAPADKVAVVTGAASGIGKACAQRLATDGLSVAIWDLNTDAAEVAAKEIEAAGGTAIGVGADVADRASLEAALAFTTEQLGVPTVLVNNAGIDGFAPFLKISTEKWQRILDINLTGTFHCCQLLIPGMVDAGWGRIVNISSSSAQGGQPYMAHYVSSKAGMIGLTKSLALEFGPSGITVNTIPPGFIVTPMLRAAESKGYLGGPVEEHEGRTPVRRAGTPEDIAAMCSFCVREEAGYVTGQVLGVNGGRNT
jgi:NAD(P)-dependent dehydrogenase (short-subunit alcohol dehydrogenase family)